MSKHTALTAQPREKAGKGAARATRREGRIPAVIYGGKKDPVLISLEHRDIVKELNKGTFFTHLCDIEVAKDKYLTLPRDVQLDPVKDQPTHIDFLRVTEKTKISVDVPVHIVGEDNSPGLDRGGVLSIMRHEIEVNCRATDIPEHIDVDISALDIGDSIHINEVSLPDGVTPTTDRDFTIASVLAPTLAVEEEPTEGEAGEGDATAEDAKPEESASEAKEEGKASDKD